MFLRLVGKAIKIVGVRCYYYSPLLIADVIYFKNYVLPLKANFQHIRCEASFCHYFTLGNEVKTICSVKTIEVANKVIIECEIKTGTKCSIHIQICSIHINIFKFQLQLKTLIFLDQICRKMVFPV